jgi:hypothetical protein
MSKRLDRSELEVRRIEAGKLLQRGVRPAEVAGRGEPVAAGTGCWRAAQLAWCTTHGSVDPVTGWQADRDAHRSALLRVRRMAAAQRRGFSSQRPAKRAMQRDEAAVRQWKTKRWPAGVHR